MRINQGIVIVSIAVILIIIGSVFKLTAVSTAGFIILGFGVFRFNDYWGEKKKGERSRKTEISIG